MFIHVRTESTLLFGIFGVRFTLARTPRHRNPPGKNPNQSQTRHACTEVGFGTGGMMAQRRVDILVTCTTQQIAVLSFNGSFGSLPLTTETCVCTLLSQCNWFAHRLVTGTLEPAVGMRSPMTRCIRACGSLCEHLETGLFFTLSSSPGVTKLFQCCIRWDTCTCT